MSSKKEYMMKEKPTDAKVVLASTFAKSFSSMPKLLRWGTILAMIVGAFYFMFVQKYIKEYKDDNQIAMMQNTVDDLSLKLKIVESNQLNTIEIYEEVEEIQKIFNVFAESERKKVKAFILFLRSTHGRNFNRDQYENAINHFENEDYGLQKEYQDKVQEIFKNRLRKRLQRNNQNIEKERNND